jgi:hypothetical protein
MNMPKGLRHKAARFCPLLAAAASLLALVSSANAIIITTTAVSDISMEDSDGNGSYDVLHTGLFGSPDPFIRVFAMGSGSRGVWEFSLAGIPATATINSANVTFHDRGTSISGGISMLLSAYAGDGTVSLTDANNISVQVGSFSIPTPNTIYTPTLNLAVIQSLISSGAPYLGLVMRTNVIGRIAGADFCSIEPGVQPLCAGIPGSQLTIDYSLAADPSAVPIPPALILFASGIAAIGLLARRRKKHA